MDIQQNVKDYYGKVLKSSADLKTDACCTPVAEPAYIEAAIANVHPEVSARYYGCGLTAPQALGGRRILDLGCGAGRDVYVLAQLAGAEGEVVGVDMTPEQLDVAEAHRDWHAKKFGYANVRFIDGDIERLDALDLEPESFDVIVSNCVVNLTADKEAVFRGGYALLRQGGEFHVADIYADRRLSAAQRDDPVARGECLGGALYWNDFLNMARRAGFLDPRVAADRPVSIKNAALAEKLAPARFYSATYRLFKIESLEPDCEDYGQAVVYKGGLAGSEGAFALDKHHVMENGRIFPVCGNTCRILKESRFAPWFAFLGDDAIHYGIFPGCGTSSPFGDAPSKAAEAAPSCC